MTEVKIFEFSLRSFIPKKSKHQKEKRHQKSWCSCYCHLDIVDYPAELYSDWSAHTKGVQSRGTEKSQPTGFSC